MLLEHSSSSWDMLHVREINLCLRAVGLLGRNRDYCLSEFVTTRFNQEN